MSNVAAGGPVDVLGVEGVLGTLRGPVNPRLDVERVWVICDGVPSPGTCAAIAGAVSTAPETMRPGMDQWRQWAEYTFTAAQALAMPPLRTFLTITDRVGWCARLRSGDHALELAALSAGTTSGAVPALDTRRAPTLADFILSPEEGILTFQQILAELVVNGVPARPGSDAARALDRICDTFREQVMRNALRVASRNVADAPDVPILATALGDLCPEWAERLQAQDEHGQHRVAGLMQAFERITGETGIV